MEIELKDREKTLKWFSCSSFETELREFVKKWVPETCKWVGTHQEYKKWDDTSAGAPQFLWIFGKPGCGKTFLSHSIRQRLSQEGGIVLYFYFNSKQNDSGKQSANAFYQTIIYQLLKALEGTATSAECYSVAHELRRNTGANTSITNERLLSTLKDILLKIGTRVNIVIDALDECKEDNQEFVESSVSLCRDIPSLKVVITSRPELNIVDRFTKISSEINIRLDFSKTESNHDIDLYIEQRLQNSKTLGDKMFPEMTKEIREKLRKKAGGLFLYVRLMLDLLEQQATEEGIRNGLESLPETLVGIYQNIIQKIEKNASKDLGEMARRVLRWVAAAQRPLTIDGLMMALRAEKLKAKENPTISDLGPFIPNYRERLWQICFPLLEVLEDDTVQVIHVSLKQYLLGQNISGQEPVTTTGGDRGYFRYNPPEEHLELALTCVAYLSVQKLKPIGLSEIESDGNVNKPESEFFVYATLEWTGHCLASEDGSSREQSARLLKYFQGPDQLKSWTEDRAAFDERFAVYFHLGIGTGGLITGNLPNLIHICAYFGLATMSGGLITQDKSELDRRDTTGRTPLHIAAERNWATLVDFYIEQALQARGQQTYNYNYGNYTTTYGPLVESKDNSGKTALHRAAARGNRLPVISLRKAGYSADSPDNLLQTPLLLAALSGEKDVVLELWNSDKSLSCASKSGVTPLDCLIMHGHEETLKSLLTSGKLVSEVLLKSSPSAFITAARKGLLGVVDLLLHAKIDVNSRDNMQQTALHRAATWGHTEVVELLLRPEWGTGIDAEDQSNRTPLYFAAAGGHIAIVKCLIQAGANVNALDRRNQTILFEPAGRGHTPVVKELLGAGVRAEQVDHWKRSALHWASKYGRKEVVELLLNSGADLHGEQREKETPLHWAAQNGQDTMIEQLINAGANVEVGDEQGRTPLHHGAWRGMQASVYALLKHVSAPDVVDHNGRTPLYWGAVSGDSGVVQTLLDANANITAGDTRGVTPLHMAARYGHDALLKRFIDTQANLDVRDNKNATPLHFAAQAGKQNATRLLLDAGASPIAADFKKRTPTWNQTKKNDEAHSMVSVLNEAKENAESKYLSQLPGIHEAARKGEDTTIRNLITRGTNIDAKDARGRSALHWAALRGHNVVFLRLVLAAGANIELSDDSGQTAIHLGVKNHHPAVVRQCLVDGADVMVKDSCGQIPLHLAVEGGQGEIVTQLLESTGSQAGVNVADNWTRTPLHFAAEGRWKAILVRLLACDASTINSGDYKGQTPLHRAARKGYHDIIDELLKAGAKLDVTDTNERTALHLAAKYGYPTVVEKLLAAGANIATKDKSGRTALYLAAGNGHESVVDVLLKSRSRVNVRDSVNVKDSENITPLQCTAEKGWAGVAKRLLKAGADVSTQDGLERTALHLAAQNSHKGTVDVLVDAGAGVDIKDYWQNTPLCWASKNGHYAIAVKLLGAGAKTSVVGDAQDTPLHSAVQNDHGEIVKLLIGAGADPDATLHNTGETPLHMAVKNGNLVVTRYLLDSCADVRALDASLETPLHHAAREGHAGAARLLLECGADIEARNAEGKTPADIAKLSQRTKVMELFVRFNS